MIVGNNAFKLLVISFLLLSALSFSRIAFAQEVPNSGTTPTGGAMTEETGTSEASTNLFNLLWLLPLIAIPILLYLLWPRKRENRMDLSNYAGVKGGLAERGENEAEEKPRARKDIGEILNSIIP